MGEREYLVEKLRPGDEDKALSEVISEAFQEEERGGSGGTEGDRIQREGRGCAGSGEDSRGGYAFGGGWWDFSCITGEREYADKRKVSRKKLVRNQKDKSRKSRTSNKTLPRVVACHITLECGLLLAWLIIIILVLLI